MIRIKKIQPYRKMIQSKRIYIFLIIFVIITSIFSFWMIKKKKSEEFEKYDDSQQHSKKSIFDNVNCNKNDILNEKSPKIQNSIDLTQNNELEVTGTNNHQTFKIKTNKNDITNSQNIDENGNFNIKPEVEISLSNNEISEHRRFSKSNLEEKTNVITTEKNCNNDNSQSSSWIKRNSDYCQKKKNNSYSNNQIEKKLIFFKYNNRVLKQSQYFLYNLFIFFENELFLYYNNYSDIRTGKFNLCKLIFFVLKKKFNGSNYSKFNNKVFDYKKYSKTFFQNANQGNKWGPNTIFDIILLVRPTFFNDLTLLSEQLQNNQINEFTYACECLNIIIDVLKYILTAKKFKKYPTVSNLENNKFNVCDEKNIKNLIYFLLHVLDQHFEYAKIETLFKSYGSSKNNNNVKVDDKELLKIQRSENKKPSKQKLNKEKKFLREETDCSNINKTDVKEAPYLDDILINKKERNKDDTIFKTDDQCNISKNDEKIATDENPNNYSLDIEETTNQNEIMNEEFVTCNNVIKNKRHNHCNNELKAITKDKDQLPITFELQEDHESSISNNLNPDVKNQNDCKDFNINLNNGVDFVKKDENTDLNNFGGQCNEDVQTPSNIHKTDKSDKQINLKLQGIDGLVYEDDGNSASIKIECKKDNKQSKLNLRSNEELGKSEDALNKLDSDEGMENNLHLDDMKSKKTEEEKNIAKIVKNIRYHKFVYDLLYNNEILHKFLDEKNTRALATYSDDLYYKTLRSCLHCPLNSYVVIYFNYTNIVYVYYKDFINFIKARNVVFMPLKQSYISDKGYYYIFKFGIKLNNVLLRPFIFNNVLYFIPTKSFYNNNSLEQENKTKYNEEKYAYNEEEHESETEFNEEENKSNAEENEYERKGNESKNDTNNEDHVSKENENESQKGNGMSKIEDPEPKIEDWWLKGKENGSNIDKHEDNDEEHTSNNELQNENPELIIEDQGLKGKENKSQRASYETNNEKHDNVNVEQKTKSENQVTLEKENESQRVSYETNNEKHDNVNVEQKTKSENQATIAKEHESQKGSDETSNENHDNGDVEQKNKSENQATIEKENESQKGNDETSNEKNDNEPKIEVLKSLIIKQMSINEDEKLKDMVNKSQNGDKESELEDHQSNEKEHELQSRDEEDINKVFKNSDVEVGLENIYKDSKFKDHETNEKENDLKKEDGKPKREEQMLEVEDKLCNGNENKSQKGNDYSIIDKHTECDEINKFNIAPKNEEQSSNIENLDSKMADNKSNRKKYELLNEDKKLKIKGQKNKINENELQNGDNKSIVKEHESEITDIKYNGNDDGVQNEDNEPKIEYHDFQNEQQMFQFEGSEFKGNKNKSVNGDKESKLENNEFKNKYHEFEIEDKKSNSKENATENGYKESKTEDSGLKIKENESQNRDHESEINEHDFKIEENKSKIEENESQNGDHESETNEHDFKIDENKSKIEENETQNRDHESEINEHDFKIEENKSKIEENESRNGNDYFKIKEQQVDDEKSKNEFNGSKNEDHASSRKENKSENGYNELEPEELLSETENQESEIADQDFNRNENISVNDDYDLKNEKIECSDAENESEEEEHKTTNSELEPGDNTHIDIYSEHRSLNEDYAEFLYDSHSVYPSKNEEDIQLNSQQIFECDNEKLEYDYHDLNPAIFNFNEHVENNELDNCDDLTETDDSDLLSEILQKSYLFDQHENSEPEIKAATLLDGENLSQEPDTPKSNESNDSIVKETSLSDPRGFYSMCFISDDDSS